MPPWIAGRRASTSTPLRATRTMESVTSEPMSILVATAVAKSASTNPAMSRRHAHLAHEAGRSRRSLTRRGSRRPSRAQAGVGRVRREDGGHAPVIDDRDPVAERAQLGQLRRGHDQRDALVAVQRGEDLEDSLLGSDVDPRRLVHEEEPGREGHRPRDADLLLVPPRDAARAAWAPSCGRPASGSSPARGRGAGWSSGRSADGKGAQEPSLRLERGERDVQLHRLVGQQPRRAGLRRRRPARDGALRGDRSRAARRGAAPAPWPDRGPSRRLRSPACRAPPSPPMPKISPSRTENVASSTGSPACSRGARRTRAGPRLPLPGRAGASMPSRDDPPSAPPCARPRCSAGRGSRRPRRPGARSSGRPRSSPRRGDG